MLAMLKIREEQMRILGEYMLRRFKDSVARHLRETLPKQTATMMEAELRALVDAGIEKAEIYGITAEDDVQTFLEYLVSYSHDFDINPETSWAGDILSRKDFDGASKMIRLKNTASLKKEA